MRTKIIIGYSGISLIMVAIMMAVSAAVAVVNGYDDSANPLIFSSIITFLVGLYPTIFVHPDPNITTKEGIAIVVVSWMVCCIFGMIPYLCYGPEFSPVDAFFESVSGFTTTGASVIDNVEAFPKGLLFWRISTAWVGGLGIVSFFSLVIPRSMDLKSVLSSAEISDMTRTQSSRSGRYFVRTILSVYMILTIACTAALKLAGLGWFDAVTNAMSTCSTCGFCVRNASIASYGSLWVEMIIIVFMTVSGISFMMLSSFVLHKRRISTTTLAFLSFLAVVTGVITLNLYLSGYGTVLHSLRQAAFQVSSISTTTGFATADTNLWPAFSIILLIFASIFCGCSGSTSGGIKMDRAVLLYSYIRNGIRSVIYPHRVLGTKIDGRVITDSEASEAMKFVLVYVALIVADSIINTCFGIDIKTSVTAAIACVGNVGPGFGAVGSMQNYSDFPSILKFTSSVSMIAGRLEILPILSFIGITLSRDRS